MCIATMSSMYALWPGSILNRLTEPIGRADLSIFFFAAMVALSMSSFYFVPQRDHQHAVILVDSA